MILRTYENAIKRLNELLEKSKSSVVPPLNTRMDMQRAYLKASGFDLDAIDGLNIIHVAGSKGKGSTCAYIESILRHEGYRTGLLTYSISIVVNVNFINRSSPHLINIEERIRVNGEPVNRNVFAENFWALVDRFDENKENYGEYCDPLYLSHILHLALRIFMAQRVDVVILEVGLGGKYDKTNFVRRPLVTAVSSIELEHTNILGKTLPKIAWSKAGIFKTSVPAVVARGQQDEVIDVFIEVAHRVKCPLYIAPSLEDIQCQFGNLETWHRLKQMVDEAPVREKNICLALAAVSLWHSEKARISAGFGNSISVISTQVVGRFQQLNISEHVIFYLDCAHTIESIKHCTQWFQSASRSPNLDGRSSYKILLFTVTGKRDPLPMLEILEKMNFDAVYFVGYFSGPLGKRTMRLPNKQPASSQCVKRWRELNYSSPCYELANDNFAGFIEQIQKWDGASTLHLISGDILVKKIQVFATGSLYLVGDVLKLLGQPLKWT
ncbi:hypothetical protein Aperf_G00000119795 [Anoplocephala perfoliata]